MNVQQRDQFGLGGARLGEGSPYVFATTGSNSERAEKREVTPALSDTVIGDIR